MARSKLHQKRLRSPFSKKQKNSSNNGQGSIQNIDRAPSSPEFAAQNSAELGSRGAGSDEPARILKRPRLPKKFLDAVAHLGIKNAVPKTIMQLKNDDGDNNGGGGNKNKKKDSYLEHLDLSSPKLNVVSEDLPISFIKLDLSSCIELEKGPTLRIFRDLRLRSLQLVKNPHTLNFADFPTLKKWRTKMMADADLGRVNLLTQLGSIKKIDFYNCKRLKRLPKMPELYAAGDADGDADNDGGDDRDNNDGGDDRDNNGGGGDKNKKKGGGHSDGEGNGDGGDKAEGGDGEEKGMNKDCTGQLGFSYRCTYHAGYENGYPVEQLHALIMFYLFCSENMMNYCSIMPPVRDVSLIDMGLNSADSMQEGRT